LASASTDLTIKLWDIEKGVEKQEITGHNEIIQSLAWNYNGSLLATTCRDKKLRVFDVRSNEIVQEGPGHQGIKGSRVVWLGNSDRLATTGFSRMSDRQLNLWDSNNLEKPLKSEFLDTSSGVLMPFYDTDTKMLYLAGKGDGNIRYYEYDNDELYPLSEYKAIEPQRGMYFLPKRALNVNECEIARAYKVGTTLIEPISFTVPRKVNITQITLILEIKLVIYLHLVRCFPI
jgi:WD40 repeat protein